MHPALSPTTSLRAELRQVLRLGVPVAITQLASMMLGIVDFVMLGRIGSEALGGANLGRVWVIGTQMLVMGILLGVDPLISQAHGARSRARLSAALQQGFVLALVLSLPMVLLWLPTGRVLAAFDQDPVLCALGRDYAWARIPGAPFFLLFLVYRSWLQGRGLMRPTLLVVLAGNLLNVGANWVLIYGKLGFPALGVVGAGLATSIVEAFMLVAMVVLVRAARLGRGAWTGWSRAAFDRAGFARIFALGLPVGAALGLEVWAFQLATLGAGWLGRVPLAAHTIALSLASVTFMVPLGLAIAASTRVGNLIGARREQDAQLAAWAALLLGAGVMSIGALLILFGRELLPRLFVGPDQADVIALSAAILPIAAAFQIFDGTQVVAGGILRGMGRTRPAALFHLLGFYGLALPLAWLLAFRAGWGLSGIWWGLALGLGVIALALVVWIWRRGPARAALHV